MIVIKNDLDEKLYERCEATGIVSWKDVEIEMALDRLGVGTFYAERRARIETSPKCATHRTMIACSTPARRERLSFP